MTQNLIFIED